MVPVRSHESICNLELGHVEYSAIVAAKHLSPGTVLSHLLLLHLRLKYS